MLNVSISQAGLAGLDDVVEQLPAIAYYQFLELLFSSVEVLPMRAMTVPTSISH